ncbi:antiterminator LoaP [Anaerorhabdus furcosa]|uniref:Transcriptional antiterminator NusG n=1 Tax=Anaerorhabdus furcosa TaxID=118967 RepID=A0A1T4ND96_9FIRM|nr:antiterminator LoaP [Anaerorhabdus furcosa]SJZ77311.1 transcriptional antiterminator NusG [Anaerorhabdus furcosa]
MMWYIIYVRGGQENKISTFLNEHHLTSFIPMKEKYHKKDGKLLKVHQILFSNYVFIESDKNYIEFTETFNQIKIKNKNLIKQLRYDIEGTPPLRDDEIQFLKKLLGLNKIVESSIGLIENDQVIITDGPLMGFESSIVYINRHKKEAKLEIDLLGSKREVTVSLEILTKT